RAAGAAGGYQRGRASVGKDTAPASDARIVPGVQRTRATPRPWAGLCRRAGARQPETLHRAGARRSQGGRSELAWEGRAPARPRCRGVAHPRYAWTCAGCVVERVLDNPKPFIELVLDVPSDDVQSLPGRDEHQLVRGAGV